MAFNGFTYGLFLPFAVALYFLAPLRLRNYVLLAASYFFYAAWNPLYLPLIIAMTAANFGMGLVLGPRDGVRRHGLWLALAVGANLAVLAYYKYSVFLAANLQAIGLIDPRRRLGEQFLPLGISFFTFEFVHYVSDVWSGKPVERSPLRFAIFAAFFPTQIAGPIKRYEAFDWQLDRPSCFTWERAAAGGALILSGLFKKIVVADSLAPLVAAVFDRRHIATPLLRPEDAWLGVLAFAIQIYFDFSGYTDIGRGSATVLGFDVPENFRRPYLARNVSEFWRRWHISLSTWLRDYLYIPLGGGRAWRYRNLMVTMLLGGLWHGASWTFVLWGAFHGALLVGYWALRSLRPEREPGSPLREAAGAVASWAFTFALVSIGWIFFRAHTLEGALSMVGDLFGLHEGMPRVLPREDRAWILLVAIGVLAGELWLDLRERLRAAPDRPPGWLIRVDDALRDWAPVGYALLAAAIIVFHHTGEVRFIYFRF